MRTAAFDSAHLLFHYFASVLGHGFPCVCCTTRLELRQLLRLERSSLLMLFCCCWLVVLFCLMPLPFFCIAGELCHSASFSLLSTLALFSALS